MLVLFVISTSPKCLTYTAGGGGGRRGGPLSVIRQTASVWGASGVGRVARVALGSHQRLQVDVALHSLIGGKRKN